MIPFFNLRGYYKEDPLDKLPLKNQLILALVVGALVTYGFTFLVFNVLDIATLKYDWLIYVETIVLALFYVPVVILLRKSSSLLFIIILVISMLPIDLYLQSQFRDQGLIALWDYSPNSIISWLPTIPKILTVWIGDAIVIGLFSLWLCRILAKYLFNKGHNRKHNNASPLGLSFFKPQENSLKPARNLIFYAFFLLGIIYTSYFFLLLLGFFGASPWPEFISELITQNFANHCLGINTFIKVSIVASISFIGAYNQKLQWHCGIIIIWAHLVSCIASIGLYYLPEPDPVFRKFLFTSFVIDLIILVIFLFVVFKSRNTRIDLSNETKASSLIDRLSRLFYIIFGSILGLIVPGIIFLRIYLDGHQDWGAVYGFPDPQVANTLTKYATLSFIAFLLANKKSLRQYFEGSILTAYSISVIFSGIILLFGDMLGDIAITTRQGSHTTVDWYFMLNVLMDAGVWIMIFTFRNITIKTDNKLASISPTMVYHINGLSKISDVQSISQKEILSSTDNKLRNAIGLDWWWKRICLLANEHVFPKLFGFRPAFSKMDKVEQTYFFSKFLQRSPELQSKSNVPYISFLGVKSTNNVLETILANHSLFSKQKSK